MKKATKVFIWIGMIMQCWLLFPIIVGICALRKLDRATSRDDLRKIGVLTILFCSVLGGVFMLNIKEEELNNACSIPGSKVILYRQESVSYEKNPNFDLGKMNAKNSIKRWLWLLLLVLVVAIPCLGVGVGETSGAIGFSFLGAIINFILYIILLICYKAKKSVLSKFTNRLLKAIVIISAIGLLLSIWGMVEVVRITGPWCVIGGILVSFSCAIIYRILYLSYTTKQAEGVEPEMVKKVTYIETSNVEIEIEQLKRLLEKEMVTEEEYQEIRKSILKKYYGCDFNSNSNSNSKSV